MTIEKAIEVLERRLQHLTERIKKAKVKGKDLSFDKREVSALKKAIRIMEDVIDFQGYGPDENDPHGTFRNCALTEEECEALSIDFIQHHLNLVY